MWLKIAQDFVDSEPDSEEWICKSLGISQPTRVRFKLGFLKGQPDHTFHDPRILIPTWDRTGLLRNLRCYRPGAKQRKVLPLCRGMKPSLFAFDQIPAGTKTLILAEGERDCMVLYEHGFVAVSSTGGAGTWLDEWSRLVAELGVEHVIILYDHDDAGREGVKKAASSLVSAGIKVLIASWPEESPPGFDVADWFSSGKSAEQLQSDVLEKATKCECSLVRKTSCVIQVDGRPVLYLATDRPIAETTANLTDVLIQSNRIFRRGTDIWCADAHRAFAITNRRHLGGALNGYVEFCKYIKDDETLDENGMSNPIIYYCNPPFELFERLQYSHEMDRLLPLNHYSKVPVFDTDFNLIPPGYHDPTGIFYAGEVIEPSASMEHLKLLCSEFAWKHDETDKANYIGALLTALLVMHFPGGHPGVVLNGNQPSLGKTLAANLTSLIVGDKDVESVTYTQNDEEFEKQIATQVDRGALVILIDNIKANVESAVLERAITSKVLTFRRLGKTEAITMPNTTLFFLTVNNGLMSRDLATRCMPINLYYEGPAEQREFTNPDLEEYAVANRQAILAELVGMVARWVEAGRPDGKGYRGRFNRWAKTIGGVLAVSGFEGFLGNWAEMTSQMSTEADEITKLASVVLNLKRVNLDLTAKELVQIAREHELFEQAVSKGGRGAVQSLGHHLVPFKGMTIKVDDDVEVIFHIRHDASGNKNVYRFEFDGELSETAKLGLWKPKESPLDERESIAPIADAGTRLDAHRIEI
ncbi:MAG: hypothetical protein A49_15980 [Methyloceanibacter sp.]|nr:MAG: hypothetical protein A49_15980 [Methyloceanibacter sp.]